MSIAETARPVRLRPLVNEHAHEPVAPVPASGPAPRARAGDGGRARLWWGAAAGVVGVAIALRLIALTSKALWFDETYSVFVASQPLVRLLAIVATNDAHPPLYYLLLHVWIGLFGDSEAAVRALSLLLSAGIVMVTWRFGRRLVGDGPALVASVLAAVAPSQISTGQEARMGALLVLVVLVSWWALWEACDTPTRRAWMRYAAASALMLFSHYYGFFVLASQAIYVIWKRQAGLDLRGFALGALGALLLFSPWIPALAGQLAGGRAWPAHRFPLTPAMFVDTFSLMAVGYPVWATPGSDGAVPSTWRIAQVGFGAVVLLVAAGARWAKTDASAAAGRLLFTAAVSPVLLSYGVSFLRNIYSPRYLVLITPFMALLAATGLFALVGSRARWPTVVGGSLAALILIPNVLVVTAYYRQPARDVFDWRRISHVIAAAARPDDAIVFLPGFARIPVNYYFRGPQPRLALTPQSLESGDAGKREMQAAVDTLARHPRVWILTVVPVPPSVGTLIDAMRSHSYAIRGQQAINMAHLVLLERTTP